ncbi:type I polyketide synthase [Rhizohabitans arisaemae]|uniref:type I polyketide synthase n=1 Tax=Rhizohabitans arisaemae TaxID=2720610 RepID=UPI0024B206FD|nr:type I polyketide synthase [Rhizohabitans arisaemae]
MTRIAIVGMACRYPDASSPRELWENAVAGRRAFRRLPDVRMRLEDYWDADPAAPDRLYSRTAAVIEGYEFDRLGYKIAGSTYRSTDLTHWLALDMAGRALADAGFPGGEGLPHERTGVIVGNSLTGEFTRANVLRLRWPYVRRTLTAALAAEGWDDDRLAGFLAELETAYKSPFPEVDEDTLAGGLSNTIAGRICNHFDLGGGGYTVDGACSSSLLAVATAAKALSDGDVDVAVAGGVDLSIDPFELVGFAKTGALAKGDFRLYDRHSNGFWPGEGCGMLVLMREQDAAESGRRGYASVTGWGVSSDGRGGMTRPEVAGYRRALRRAYERAGVGIDTVSFFEGHGTGTALGDATELAALTAERTAADPAAAPAAVGSIKGMIGHAKAAAGVAGLIKATMAVHEEVLPPTLGCVDPHPVFGQEPVALRVLRKAEPWPAGAPIRAGVTAMGFGGINTHLVLEKTEPRRRTGVSSRTRSLAASLQDVELLLADAASPEGLRERLTELADFVPQLSYAQLADLAATLQGELRDLPYRAAAVVSSPDEAEQQLRRLIQALDAGEQRVFDGGAFLGRAARRPSVGFLFPGQGSGRGTSGGALRRRLAEVEEIYLKAALPTSGDMVATHVAQPRIATGSIAGLRALSLLGVEADVAVGHSLGELSALHWAGAMDSARLLRLAAGRGRAMAEHSASGTMAGLRATPDQVNRLIAGLSVVIAGYNGPEQTVVAGTVEEIETMAGRAAGEGVPCMRLPVSHAFHSPLVAPAAESFGARLTREEFAPLSGRVVSTVTGDELSATTDLRELLHRQITDPVLFTQAVERAAKDVDLFIEVGPGHVLTGLVTAAVDVPAVALDTDDESLTGLLRTVAAGYVLGVPVRHEELFHGRLIRPLRVGQSFSFFANPAEQAPAVGPQAVVRRAAPEAEGREDGPAETAESTLDMLRRLAAARAELPLDMVSGDARPLDELHLSSVTVMHLIDQAAKRLRIPAAQVPVNLATASLCELATALDTLSEATGVADSSPVPAVAGAAPWARAFAVDLDEIRLPKQVAAEAGGTWRVFAPGGAPLAAALRGALENGQVGSGVLVYLPPDCAEEDLEHALLGAQAVLSAARGTRFVLVQHGRGAAGLAKTLSLEAPQLRVTVAQVPPIPEAVGWVVAEVAATTGFSEVRYDEAGLRRVPTLRALPVRPGRVQPVLDSSDVFLVTGGGKGITAECALAVAGDSGAKLAVLGRSDPARDPELAGNLRRMAEAGVRVHYVRADTADADRVRAAVAEVEETLGPVTAVLHGAGRNEPAGLATLDMAAFRRTFAPKVDGMRNVLAAIEPGRLRLLVSFGSIIGRAGLHGEAHYATANEWLADLTEQTAARHPDCRTVCMEWSVWSEVGMGERLSVVDGLTRRGIVPIAPEQGVELLRRLVADPGVPAVVVISGRTEGIGTVRRDLPDLPLLRFVGKPLVRYHGVELVTEVELGSGTDLYLADHLLDGNLLFPAVFGMEAMAQTAAALTGRDATPVIEQAEFVRPIIVSPDGSSTIRIAATVVDDDTVAVSIRSAETGFDVEHFRARLVYGLGPAPAGPPDQTAPGLPGVPLDPATAMYGDVLFQGPRFHRLRRYHRAAARHVDADVAAVADGDWFAGFLPGELRLGDPGLRDALMHGNQVCVPDATLLPTGIERIHPGGPDLARAGELRYCAVEREHHGDTYVYDIAVRTAGGEVVERWEGLRLQAVRKKDGRGPWAAPLLGSYLERTLEDLVGTRVAVAVEPDEAAPAALAAGRALGRPVRLAHVGDGEHAVEDGRTVAVAHGAGTTLCAVGEGPLACAVEPVTARPAEAAHAPLTEETAALTREAPETADTRVRAALTCLRRAGAAGGDVRIDGVRDAWAVFASGGLRVATLVTTLHGVPDPIVFAVLTTGGDRS